jgi:hypothetical protein
MTLLNNYAKLSISGRLEHTLQLHTIPHADQVPLARPRVRYSLKFRKSIKDSSRSQARSAHTHNV